LTGGIWGTGDAAAGYDWILTQQVVTDQIQPAQIVSTGVGAVFVSLLAAGRARWSAFPLHPLGWALALARGNKIWSEFLVVWLCKTVALRYGGSRTYQELMPFFLGFALGYLVSAGFIWGLLAPILGHPYDKAGISFY
jgi:hypothetical protein